MPFQMKALFLLQQQSSGRKQQPRFQSSARPDVSRSGGTTAVAITTLNKLRLLRSKSKDSNEQGFTLLEMVMATLVLTVGLLGVASAIGYALLASNRGRGITNAKMLIVAVQEQMETVRDTGQLTFAEISNSHVNGSTFTYFPTEFMPVSSFPGPDGIYGTNDDLISSGRMASTSRLMTSPI